MGAEGTIGLVIFNGEQASLVFLTTEQAKTLIDHLAEGPIAVLKSDALKREAELRLRPPVGLMPLVALTSGGIVHALGAPRRSHGAQSARRTLGRLSLTGLVVSP
jgi:hypothetical protein